MADEDIVLDEAMDNLKEAGQRIRATQSLMRSQGMTDGENHRDLLIGTLLMTDKAIDKPHQLIREWALYWRISPRGPPLCVRITRSYPTPTNHRYTLSLY